MAAISMDSIGGASRVAAPVASGVPRTGRAGAIGAGLGFLISVGGVTLAGAAAGMDVGAAFVLSLFVGVWGGLGFGFMTGATLCLALHTDREAASLAAPPLQARTHTAPTDTAPTDNDEGEPRHGTAVG